MDMTSLMLSLLFGCVGMGFMMYGKSSSQMIPVGAGLALMICPYFIANVIVLLIVCTVLSVLPFVLREA